MSEPFDTVFSLPAVDDDPGTEIGVLLMGLSPERLLAGLGVASENLAESLSGDPAAVTMYVDQLRHGAREDDTFARALATGAQRWRTVRARLAGTPGVRSAALRRLWSSAAAALAEAEKSAPELRTAGGAERVYLVACWLRYAEITGMAEENIVPPQFSS